MNIYWFTFHDSWSGTENLQVADVLVCEARDVDHALLKVSLAGRAGSRAGQHTVLVQILLVPA